MVKVKIFRFLECISLDVDRLLTDSGPASVLVKVGVGGSLAGWVCPDLFRESTGPI